MNGGQNGGPGFPPGDDRPPYGGPGDYGATQPQGGYGAQGPYGGGNPQGWPGGGEQQGWPGRQQGGQQQGWQSGQPGGGQQGWQPGQEQSWQGGQVPDAGTWSYGLGSEPPRKSRTGLIVGLAIAGVVIVLGGIAAVIGVTSGNDEKPAADKSPAGSASPSPTSSAAGADVPHSIVIPKSVGDYRQLTGAVADRLAQTMRDSMGKDQGQYAEAYSKAKIAIFAKNGDATHPLVFVGLSGSDSPQIAEELKSRSPSEEVDSTFLGMGLGDAKDYPAGPLGGVLRCGTGPMGNSTAAACAWADHSTVGALITPQSSGVQALAGTTLDLRNAAEK